MLAVLLSFPLSVAAQSGDRWSFQVSGLANYNDFGSGGTPLGGEIQIRHTPGVISIGGGVQFLSASDADGVFAPVSTFDINQSAYDESLSFVGVFVEPRWVYAASDQIAGYLSSRVSASRIKEDSRWAGAYCDFELTADCERVEYDDVSRFEGLGVTGNLGGGFLIRLTNAVNLDVGATGGIQFYPSGEGFYRDFDTNQLVAYSDSETVLNVVVRVGLAIGIGG